MARINWKVEIKESFVEMPAAHIPVYLEAQRVIMKMVLDILRESGEIFEKAYLEDNHAKVN